MSLPIITVENLGKRYRICHQQGGRIRYKALRDVLADTTKSAACRIWSMVSSSRGRVADGLCAEDFWALKNVSFEINEGDVLGIIGRNGAGKSTLLKILSRITEPTEGCVRIKGRVASLLEVGTGFHPELTGRENIFLNGAILGMTKVEIKKKFAEIVAFAEVEKFLDTPVKRYSSGMYVRLAFAVAAHLESEILIVDEVLAVGDATFQSKCLGKMSEVAKGGRTILFTSHNMSAVRSLCSRALHFERGGLQLAGTPAICIAAHLRRTVAQSGLWKRSSLIPNGPGVFLKEIRVERLCGEIQPHLFNTEPFRIRILAHVAGQFDDAQLAVRFTNNEGVPVLSTCNTDERRGFIPILPGHHEFLVEVPGDFLAPGGYTLIVAAHIPTKGLLDCVNGEVGLRIEDVGGIASACRDQRLGVVTPVFKWQHSVNNYSHPA